MKQARKYVVVPLEQVREVDVLRKQLVRKLRANGQERKMILGLIEKIDKHKGGDNDY